MSRKDYVGKEVTVSFDPEVCRHAAECVRGLPEVFDTKKRPWIQPDNAPGEQATAEVAPRPSGAMRFERRTD